MVGEVALKPTPQRGVVGVTRWHRDQGVQVLWKDDDRVETERLGRTGCREG